MTDEELPADDPVILDIKRQWEMWERHEARRRRVAWWMLIPLGLSATQTGMSIAHVLNAGMTMTGAGLITGFAGILACQWIAPVLTNRGGKP